jgi:hypothetical protein
MSCCSDFPNTRAQTDCGSQEKVDGSGVLSIRGCPACICGYRASVVRYSGACARPGGSSS